MKKISSLLLLALASGAITLGAYTLFFEPRPIVIQPEQQETPYFPTGLNIPVSGPTAMDFTEAAENTVHAVVHVKNLTISKGPASFFDYYYGSGGTPRAQVGTGSGVIISPDGYIVTNNHVIANASELQITLNNNKTLEAELIGTDPETDIALLKIDTDEELPYLAFGNSDQVRLGEWVLAVGNPFNLTSTVTAGIVSAKARDLNELDRRFQSFIQTDAAVNPGNSGGALVNTRGELVGINTAITSQTGSYVGYSFAVPSNIARKVVEDIMEYGRVQIVNIGIRGKDLKTMDVEQSGTEETEGILISEIVEDSGADMAGLRSGDIIKSIDDIRISKFSDLTGYLRSKRPDDRVSLDILRNNKPMTVAVTLTRERSYIMPGLDITVAEQTKSDRKKFDNRSGLKITEAGKYIAEERLEGKLLIGINDMEINSVQDVKQAMGQLSKYRGLMLIVLNEDGEKERLIFRD